MPNTKIRINGYVTVFAFSLLAELKAVKGLSMTSLLEIAVREYAERNLAPKKIANIEKGTREFSNEIVSAIKSGEVRR